MMVRTLLLVVALVGGVAAAVSLSRAEAGSCCQDDGLATCRGDTPCKACKNCSKCNYCHVKGGYCGVCSKPIPE
jgi:hypothetical protein